MEQNSKIKHREQILGKETLICLRNIVSDPMAYRTSCEANEAYVVNTLTHVRHLGTERESLLLWHHLCRYEPTKQINYFFYDIHKITPTKQTNTYVGLRMVNESLLFYHQRCQKKFIFISSVCVNMIHIYKSAVDRLLLNRPNQWAIDQVSKHILVKDIHLDIVCLYSMLSNFTHGHNCEEFPPISVRFKDPSLSFRFKDPSPMLCGDSQYQCGDAHCISDYWLYDGYQDCPDGSDEKLEKASSECKSGQCHCGPHYYPCHIGGCVHWDRVCDQVNDCSDSSDEVMCTTHHYIPDPNIADITQCDYQCKNSTVCISTSRVYDLIPDCPLADDENTDKTNLSCSHQDDIPCVPGHPHCFPIYQLCVYDLDQDGIMRYCRNGAHLTLCFGYQCPTKYKCPGSYCIPARRICDQVLDCPEGEDENDCPTGNVLCPGFFRCREGPCIHPHEVCDGNIDCVTHGEDEWNCERGTCPWGCQCLGGSILCNYYKTARTNITFHQRSSLQMSGLIGLPTVKDGDTYINLKLGGTGPKHLPKNYCMNCSKLILMDLSHNKINSIAVNAFDGLFSLHMLLLNNNSLRSLENFIFKDLGNLDTLNLSSQLIESVQENAFQGLIKLQILDLSFCRLSALDVTSYTKILKLNVLYIQGNAIGTMQLHRNENISFSLAKIDSYLCCFEIFNCIVSDSLKHLCSNNFTSLKKTLYYIYGSIIFIGHISLAIYLHIRMKSRSSLRLIVICTCVDGFHGVYVLMVIGREDLFGTSAVYEQGGMKHIWCLVAAWAQQMLVVLPLLLKAMHVREMCNSVSNFDFTHTTNSKQRWLKLMAVSLCASITSSFPIFLNLIVTQGPGDASSRCSFLYHTAISNRWSAVVLVILTLIHICAVLVTVVSCYQVLVIKRRLEKELATFGSKGHTNQALNILRPCFRAIFSAVISFILTTASLVLFFSGSDAQWAYQGEWMMLMYSLPSCLQLLLHVYFDVYQRVT